MLLSNYPLPNCNPTQNQPPPPKSAVFGTWDELLDEKFSHTPCYNLECGKCAAFSSDLYFCKKIWEKNVLKEGGKQAKIFWFYT